ncbi:hypothetical protein BV898_12660 [Hypsibius exemplaris]|uniref:Uncharacterized protein n=1 Tax=Hypsibius exemplaris TaxID=2072580 RepID=A0A1W0WD48_HYPEX|nr:hypothetical protein BV898_12660 [Hypsibius exemplaris]
MACVMPVWLRKTLDWLLKILDALLSICILAPLVVAYWRGTFILLEFYVIPGKEYRVVSLLTSFIIGVVGGVLFIYLQDVFKDYAHNTPSPIAEIMLKRVYAYVYGLVVVNHWRAVWDVLDDCTGFDFNSGVFVFLTGVLVLMALRCFRNSLSPPVVAAADLSDEFFTIKTRFRVPRSKRVLFFLDALFGVLVPGSMIVFVVRGFWYMLNYLLQFPRFAWWLPVHSAFTSYGLGIVLVFASLLLQRPAAWVSRRLEVRNHWILKIVFEDLFMLLATVAGINIWRGAWGVYDEYVFKGHNDSQGIDDGGFLSAWTCHILGMGGLMLMFHASSALVKSFEIDGEYPNGEGCFLPASSLTMFKHHMGQTHRQQIIVGKETARRLAPTAEQEDLIIHAGDAGPIQLEHVYNGGSSRKNYDDEDGRDLNEWKAKVEHERRKSSV